MSKSMTEIIQERQRKLAEEQANQQKLAEEKAKKKAEKKERKPRLSPDAPNIKFDDDPEHQPFLMKDLPAVINPICDRIKQLEDRIQNMQTGYTKEEIDKIREDLKSGKGFTTVITPQTEPIIDTDKFLLWLKAIDINTHPSNASFIKLIQNNRMGYLVTSFKDLYLEFLRQTSH